MRNTIVLKSEQRASLIAQGLGDPKIFMYVFRGEMV